MYRFVCFYISLVLCFLSLVSLGKDGDVGQLKVTVCPQFNGQLLQPGQYYTDANGDTLDITMFKFYLTNIVLCGSNHSDTVRKAFLFNWQDSLLSFTTTASIGQYTHVVLNIGVDSMDNVNGANDGDLDPVNAMYWAWNSGYINVKLEGHSRVCPTLHHAFGFHLGGYMPPYRTVRYCTLSLHKPLVVSDSDTSTLIIYADVAAILKGVHLSQTNAVFMPGKAAADMANRYAHMLKAE